MQFLSLEKLGGDFRSLLYSVRGGRPTSAFSLAPGAKIHVAAELKSKVLFVTADSLQAKDVAKKFNRYFGREAAVYLPSRDDVLLYKKVGNRALYAERSFAQLCACKNTERRSAGGGRFRRNAGAISSGQRGI